MCRPDGRHVLNNQGTDDYVLTNMLRIGICDDIREEVEKQEKQVRQITYQIGIRADIRKCYSGMDLLMEI